MNRMNGGDAIVQFDWCVGRLLGTFKVPKSQKRARLQDKKKASERKAGRQRPRGDE